MQHLQDQMLTLQDSNLFGLLATSRFSQLFLYPSFIAYLLQTCTFILSNIIGLHSGHGLIWLFSRFFENSKPVIISATRYAKA